MRQMLSKYLAQKLLKNIKESFVTMVLENISSLYNKNIYVQRGIVFRALFFYFIGEFRKHNCFLYGKK